MRNKLLPHDYVMAYTILPLIPRFVSPNAFTRARFIMAPFVFLFIYIQDYHVAIILFLITAFTDVIDGSLSRVRRQVTRWGTVYDPIADKFLILGAVILLVFQFLHPIIGGIIIAMEVIFLLDGLKNYRIENIASPSWFGKIKMLFQVIGVTLLLVYMAFGGFIWMYFSTTAFIISIVLALLNIIKYGVQLSG